MLKNNREVNNINGIIRPSEKAEQEDAFKEGFILLTQKKSVIRE